MSDKEFQDSGVVGYFDKDAVRDHYDRLSFFYHVLWGEHIHHGFWEDGETPSIAQVRLIERLAARAKIPPDSRVLDVGCGLGGSALWLARELGCSVLGLNISPVQVAMARERALTEKLDERAQFRVFDANLLESLDESFDVVWVIECSEHLADKERFISNCARVLRPGGRLALCAWLRANSPPAPDHAQLVADVCRGMLCPQLASAHDYTDWMRAGLLEVVSAEEITPHVKETWMLAAAIACRPEIRALLYSMDERTRRFVEAFSLIQRAYDEGAMAYGMFTARKV